MTPWLNLIFRSTLLHEREYDHGEPAHEAGQRRQHEGRAQDSPDADLLAGVTAMDEDGDERDDRLGQSSAHGREHAAHGTLAQVELAAEPFDAVHEELAARKDHGEGDYQEEDRHGGDSNRCSGRRRYGRGR